MAMIDQANRLLISNSTLHGLGYLDHVEKEIRFCRTQDNGPIHSLRGP